MSLQQKTASADISLPFQKLIFFVLTVDKNWWERRDFREIDNLDEDDGVREANVRSIASA